MLGERRGGCDPIDLTGAGFGGGGAITVNAASSASWGVIGVTLAPNGVIAFGNAASGLFTTAASSYTHAYVVNASSNYLVVCVVGDSTTDKVTGVTYNAVAMTLLKKLNAGTTTGWIYVFGLAAPATGSHNVVVSASGSCTNLGFVAADYLAVKSTEPDSSLSQTMASTLAVTTNYTPVAGNTWALQFSINTQGQQTSVAGGSLRVFASIAATAPTLSWTGTTSGSQNYNSVTTPLVFAAGTYSLTVSGGNLSLTFDGAGGGGGGGTGNGGTLAGGSGGGGGAVTTGTSVTLVPGKTYTLVVGAGGVVDTVGAATTFVNTTDTTTLVSLGGGSPGQQGVLGFSLAGGAGGTLAVGTNGVTGGTGGATTNGNALAGTGATPGTGGGGGGGAAGAGWSGGNGGTGSAAGGAGGAPQVAGTASSGLGGARGAGAGDGGGGGGGGGVKFGFAGEAANGYGGGGGGGAGTNGTGSPAGGSGGDGLGGFVYVGNNISVTLADSNGPLIAQAAVVDLAEWFPLGDNYNSELWAVAATPNASQAVALARRSTLATGTNVWSTVTPVDPLITVTPDIYLVNAQPLDGLLFWAYSSGIDRLHVWEPATSTLRRTGLQQPSAAPALADDAGGGTYATKRYFRTRWIEKQGTKIVRRSEPSVSSNITPNGAKIGVTLTQVAGPGEGETHWEVEESLDNITFNRIATVVAATTTYDDQLASGSVSTAGPTSEAIGAYLLQPSWKYLAVDNDRLIGAGHWFDPTRFSTVGWSPVGGDPGVGNGERQPIVTTGGTAITTVVVLDNNVGGPVTGLASGLLQPQYASTASPTSIFYVFKWQRIYMLVGTGNVASAYTVTTISAKRGAIPDSVFMGIDEAGSPAVYFLDPLFGPSRITQTKGIETLPGIRTTWGRVNLAASDVIACGCYYPFKRQAIWDVSVDGGNTPTFGITYAVGETGHVAKSAADFVRGWSVMDGRRAQARCMTTYTELVTENGATRLSIRPVIGLTAPDYVQRCDVDSTDASQPFVATIISRPYSASGLLQKWGAMAGSILADAQASGALNLFLIADFGALPSAGPYPVATAASAAGESKIIKDLDSMVSSGARFIQLEFTDSATVVLS